MNVDMHLNGCLVLTEMRGLDSDNIMYLMNISTSIQLVS